MQQDGPQQAQEEGEDPELYAPLQRSITNISADKNFSQESFNEFNYWTSNVNYAGIIRSNTLESEMKKEPILPGPEEEQELHFSDQVDVGGGEGGEGTEVVKVNVKN